MLIPHVRFVPLALIIALGFAFSHIAVSGPGDPNGNQDEAHDKNNALGLVLDSDVTLAGEAITGNASGFYPNEAVVFEVGVEIDGSAEIVESWSVVADINGDIRVEHVPSLDPYAEEELVLSARGSVSGFTTQTSFTYKNTILTLTNGGEVLLCLGAGSDSTLLCAQLIKKCIFGDDLPLAGKEIKFYIGKDCGEDDDDNSGDESFSDEDWDGLVLTATTDEYGNACVYAPLPSGGQLKVKARFRGERRHEDCDWDEPNNPCAPDWLWPFLCVNLSSAVDCIAIDVNGDYDEDGIANTDDNCPCKFNPAQEDIDGDMRGDSCFMPIYLTPYVVQIFNYDPAYPKNISPIPPTLNLRITDPDGWQVGADSFSVITNTYPAGQASYHHVDGNDSIHVQFPKTGHYVVEIIPEAGSASHARALAGSYKVEMRTDGTVEVVFGPNTSPTSGIIDTIGVEQAPFLIGDVDGDGEVMLTDIIFMIWSIFKIGPPPLNPAAADANCDHKIDIADVSYLLAYVFKGGPPPGCH